MDRVNLALGKTSYVIFSISILLIVLGFILMTGPATTFERFEPDIFSTRRIAIAPMICFLGFLLMIVGILFPQKHKEDKTTSMKK